VLVKAARKADVTLELVPGVGEFVPAGSPLFRVHGDASGLAESTVGSSVVLGLERTLDQDVPYGFRMLVDVAERSLADSPFQDPTTAVQAIDRLHDCLRQMARRPFSDGTYRDGDGRVRLIIQAMDWEGYVHLAFDEIRLAGAGSPPVTRRLRAALEDLLAIAPAERRAPLERQMELLAASTEAAVAEPRDVELSLQPDPQGMGVDTRAR
jgi:uncharacterized membrane protein